MRCVYFLYSGRKSAMVIEFNDNFLLMKLHLPVFLRRCILSAFAVVAAATCMPAQAGIRHEDAYLATYTDFGQNRGRYVVGRG